jgi:hypothetical protein
MKIINATPHAIVFVDNDGFEFVVEESGYTLPAKIVEKRYEKNGVSFLRTLFYPTETGRREINDMRRKYGADAIIVGSVISAQVYQNDVVALVAAPRYERVPIHKRKYSSREFLVFGKLRDARRLVAER